MRLTITVDLPDLHPWVLDRPGVLDITDDNAQVFVVPTEADDTRFEGTILDEDL